MYLGEPVDTASLSLGKPQTVVYRQLPGYQWHLSTGLVITVVTGAGGGIKLIDETAAPADQPLGLATEGAREFGFTLNQSTHADLGLDAPSTACKGNFGADCWEYHYDNGLIMRTDFAGSGPAADGVLREVTLANESLLQQLNFNP
jgi:hypothetical protein